MGALVRASERCTAHFQGDRCRLAADHLPTHEHEGAHNKFKTEGSTDNIDTCLVCGTEIPPGPDFCSTECEARAKPFPDQTV